MRAAVIHELGATPVVEEHDQPARGEGQALVATGAAGVNPVDLAIGAGVFYGGHPPLPFVAGREGAGRVVEGETFAPGTLVATLKAASGSMAERFVADESELWEIPAEADPVVATALGIAGLAGWLAVEERGRIQEGDRVLVLGATGTVGQVAVQGAKLLGASRVVAAGRNPDGLARAAELGADATVQLGGDDLAERFRESAGDAGGFDVIVDPLWGEPGVAAMEASKRFTRHVALGQSAGMHASVSVATVRNKPLTIVGHTNYAIPFEDQQAAYAEMCGHAAAGRLTADVEATPLDDVASAWERLRAGSPGTKLVVVP